MSKQHQGRRSNPAPMPPSAQPQRPRPTEIAPPREVESQPPPLANQMVVSGGADLMRLEFYYVPFNTLYAGFVEGKGEGIEKIGDRTIIRSQPVARVALPLSMAVDLFVRMVETFSDGAHDFMGEMNENSRRVMAAFQRVSHLVPKQQQPNPAPPADVNPADATDPAGSNE